MKKILSILPFLCFSLFAQNKPDSIPSTTIDTINKQVVDTIKLKNSPNTIIDTIKPSVKIKKIYSNDDLKEIQKLLIDAKFNSPLYDSLNYVINDKGFGYNPEFIVNSDTLKARLKEINNTTPFHLSYNPALEKIINNYIKYRKKYYPALMARAKYYFPIFKHYLNHYNIPIELKYLAIVESALNPKAKSKVGATGLWQFMYGTGRQFNLNISSYVDDRQDPIKSTIAACEYLTHLYEIFNDWDLALAAYNSGPGNVLKAIKRSGGHRNYWNIRPFLPSETAGYLPAFYATMYIFKYADELNIIPEEPAIHNFETDTVHIKKTITFNQISERLNIDDKLISFLNPQYKIDIVPSIENKHFTIRLPSNKIIDFLDKEQEIYTLAEIENSQREKPLPKYFEMDKRIGYKVKNGDFLGKIAKKFGVNIQSLKRWNNLKSTKLKIGQRLYIYPKKL